MELSFFKDKNIFVTGHTGFKGAWLCKILLMAGARVTGYALPPDPTQSLFTILGLAEEIAHITGDVRDGEHLSAALEACAPAIVFHLAAQPIVRESYKNPVYTYETNVMGTVHLLDAVRRCDSVRSVVNVTTDKVYRNTGQAAGYCESDVLDGYDPYSNSKSCSELVTGSFIRSFFNDATSPAVSTARAGNVIGGGDFAVDRIIPDCIRAVQKGEPIIVRNPQAVRPYQHVLECLAGYLLLASRQDQERQYAGSYNFGPDDSGCVTTGHLVDLFCERWGEQACWIDQSDGGPHEAILLKLDCTRVKEQLRWQPTWSIDTAVEKIVSWVKAEDKNQITEDHISYFLNVESHALSL